MQTEEIPVAIEVAAPGLSSVGGLLSQAAMLYEDNFFLFLAILAVVHVPQAILSFLFPPLAFPTGLASLLAFCALIIAMDHRIRGKEISIAGAYGRITPEVYVTLLATTIMFAIMVAVGLAFFLLPGIYLFVRYMFFAWEVVLQEYGLFESFSQSANLVLDAWWRTFRVAVPFFLLPTLLEVFIGSYIAENWSIGAAEAWESLIQIFVGPFVLGMMTLLYYELRVNRYGATTAFRPPTSRSAEPL